MSKLDSPIIKTLDRHSLNVKNYISSVLIIEESNFDERKVSFLHTFEIKRCEEKKSVVNKTAIAS